MFRHHLKAKFLISLILIGLFSLFSLFSLIHISYSQTPQPSPSATEKRGDANGDGVVNLADLLLIFEHWLELIIGQIDQNQDGKINSFDQGTVLQNIPRPSPSPLVNAPNIVFVLTDDQSPESIQAMPYLRSQTDWFSFTNTFLNVSLCCPSRATILSGLYSHHTGVNDNNTGQLFDENANIAVWLHDAGYYTGLIGKYLNGYPFGRGNDVPPGWDSWQALSPAFGDHYNYTLNENGNLITYGFAEEDYSTDVFARKAISFIESAREPFFLYLAPKAPHEPFSVAPRHKNIDVGPMPQPPNFNEQDVSDKPNWVKSLNFQNQTEMEDNRRRQYRMLLAIDEAVEDMVTTLETKGVLNNTVIFYMSDNGYSHGEHRVIKKWCEYEECSRTPLLIRYPAATARDINELVSNVDITPTLAQIAGVTIPARDGLSLVPFLENDTVQTWRTGVLMYRRNGSSRGFWAIRTKEWKYVELETGEKELYDLVNDQYELENKAGQAQYATIQSQLANELIKLKE